MKRLVMLAALLALAAAPAPAQDASADLMAAARGHLAARRLDSAAVLFRQVAEAPARAIAERVQAWVLLGVVDFYRSGDSATADAFRHALTLDPGFQVAALDQYDPAIAEILTAERAALPPRAQPPAAAAAPVHDCLGRCPEGVRPPQFAFFPQIEFRDASVALHDRRMRTYLMLQVVVGADGIIEPETITVSGGTARNAESELRRGLAQARFTPGRADGVPCRTRVALRFDFEAEGTSWIKYTYRVTSR